MIMVDKREAWNQKAKSIGREDYSIQMIVIHGMATTDKELFPKEWDKTGVSAHYGIKNNIVELYVDPENTAWHAGNWSVNLRSIGVEHLNSTGAPRWDFSAETLNTSVEFIAELLKKYKLTVNDIHMHREFFMTECPQSLASLENWRNYLSRIATITGDILVIKNKLIPNGQFDSELIKKIQTILGLPEDGIICSQPESNKSIFEKDNYKGIEFVKDTEAKGSDTVREMQKRLGMRMDGFFGKKLVNKLQERYELEINGKVTSKFVYSLQGQLNTELEDFNHSLKSLFNLIKNANEKSTQINWQKGSRNHKKDHLDRCQ